MIIFSKKKLQGMEINQFLLGFNINNNRFFKALLSQ